MNIRHNLYNMTTQGRAALAAYDGCIGYDGRARPPSVPPVGRAVPCVTVVVVKVY